MHVQFLSVSDYFCFLNVIRISVSNYLRQSYLDRGLEYTEWGYLKVQTVKCFICLK